MCAFEIVTEAHEEATTDSNTLGAVSSLEEVLTRYCSYLLNSGYTESVYAVYRALLCISFEERM